MARKSIIELLPLSAGLILFTNLGLADVQQRTGDWVVTTGESISGANIVLNGNLYIRAGGSLTLNNTTLLFGHAPSGQFGIQADAGATLTISGSTLGPANAGDGFRFVVNGGQFRMDHTTVSSVGEGPYPNPGNAIAFTGVAGLILDSNTINHPYVGVSLTNCTHAVIQNNTFAYSGTAINTGIAIWTVYSHYNTITGNRMLREYGEVTLFNSWNNYMAYNEATVTKDSLGFAVADNSGYNVVAYNRLTAVEPMSCTGFRSMGTTQPNYFIGNDITGTREGGVIEYGAHVVVAGNRFHSMTDHNIGGIQVYRSHDVRVLNNQISGSPNGIVVAGSEDNWIAGNTVSGADFGIIMTRSANNRVEGNTFDGNQANVVLLTTRDNSIAGNNLTNHQRQQAYDDGTDTWAGNYFDDNRSTSYPVPGGAADASPALALIPGSVFPVPPVMSGAVPAPLLPEMFINQPTVWDGVEMDLDHAIGIGPGGKLTISNSKIWPVAGANRWLNVYGGGELVIEDSELGGNGLDAYMSLTTQPGAALTIRDSKLRYLGDWDGNRGLELGGDGAIIQRSEFLGGYGGIDAPNSGNHRFSDNRIADALASALIWFGPSVAERNMIFGTLWMSLFATGSGSSINGNWVDGGSSGIYVQGHDFAIRDNNVRNSNLGIGVGNMNGPTTNNIISGNTLIGNGRTGFGMPPTASQGADQGAAVWSENGRGNYWSTYTGADTNGDGIGDTPYHFDAPFGTDVDNDPLIEPPTPATPACVYLLGTPTARLAAGQLEAAVDVVTLQGCSWNAASNSDWITVTAGAPGTGRGTITFTATENTSTAARNGSIQVADQTLTVKQAGNCSYSLDSSSYTVSPAGGALSVTLTTSAGCAWNASSLSAWVTMSSSGVGSGSATLVFSATANPDDASRTGFLTVAGRQITVQQPSPADAAPHIDSVANAASGLAAGSVSPGSYVTLAGSRFGSGAIRVFFDSAEASVASNTDTQATVYVPTALTVGSVTMITLRAGQKTSAPFPISVAPASPALFTAAGTGIGQALALDADGALNSPSNPAPHGSILTIACTGDGGLPLQVVLAGRALTASDIVYTGPMQPGVLQINLRVPDWTPAGDAVAVLVVLGPDAQGRFYYSRDGVTLAFGS